MRKAKSCAAAAAAAGKWSGKTCHAKWEMLRIRPEGTSERVRLSGSGSGVCVCALYDIANLQNFININWF